MDNDMIGKLLLRQLGPNVNVLILPSGIGVLFSYEMPVAAQLTDGRRIVTDTYYSRTTSKHINQWDGNGLIHYVEQQVIDDLLIVREIPQ